MQRKMATHAFSRWRISIRIRKLQHLQIATVAVAFSVIRGFCLAGLTCAHRPANTANFLTNHSAKGLAAVYAQFSCAASTTCMCPASMTKIHHETQGIQTFYPQRILRTPLGHKCRIYESRGIRHSAFLRILCSRMSACNLPGRKILLCNPRIRH